MRATMGAANQIDYIEFQAADLTIRSKKDEGRRKNDESDPFGAF